MKFNKEFIKKLNQDILAFTKKHPEKHIFPVTEDMHITFEGVSQMVMLDRYSQKDLLLETLSEGDFVVVTIKEDPKWPTMGIGFIESIDYKNEKATIKVDEEFAHALEGDELETLLINRSFKLIQKPLEIFYEQIAKRNAYGLSRVEKTEELREKWFNKFYKELVDLNFVPAGRVLYGAGSGANVTYFNCFVMPFIPDSREGIANHRKTVMEIMSRGGGVGTNGSTLRPRNEVARGVNGKSSGSVSWLNDIANLTNLVEQGGSRRKLSTAS